MTRHLFIASLIAAAPACLDGDAATGGAITARDAADSLQLEIAPSDAQALDDTSDAASEPDTTELETSDALPHFSFFVTSLAALQELSGSDDGFGGDLRFGEDGAGAGLRGADRICATIAERSMPGAGQKTWRAFLSAADGGDGQPVDAIDRIGEGPWYDRLGRLVADDLAGLAAARPTDADPAIKNDLPNEDGVPNHRPDPTKAQVDNHHMLTGSTTEGRLYGASATCDSWTSTSADGRPHVGLAWPRGGGGGPGGGGGMDGTHWISALSESGCEAGVNLANDGPGDDDGTVGSGGGYGGFYCFSLVP